MTEPLLIARGEHDLFLLPNLVNRHGLVAGATGTGKTVTLQVMAESLSRAGIPVFAADVKGDLSGIAMPGHETPKLKARVEKLKLGNFSFEGSPVTLWDVFGEQGHPMRATVSEIGPVLLSRILGLNQTQSAVLSLVFKIADDHGLLLLDLKDLQAMLQFVSGQAKQFQSEYGNISAASIGAIQRGLVTLESQGGDHFLGEPALNIDDLLQTDGKGRGVINLLAADKLLQSSQLYATFLLWLLSELFERLPEVGDLEKPRLVFFFDEAHLLFTDQPSALLTKIEQVVRLIRSKGVGVYFVTQNPMDLPDTVLGQLGNRVQHALRAFTPSDQKAVKAAAQTFRSNPRLDVETVITQLEVGEALVSFLDEKGTPGIVERAYVLPPRGQIGPITPEERRTLMANSLVTGVYEQSVDRESAYERLKERSQARTSANNSPDTGSQTYPSQPAAAGASTGGLLGGLESLVMGSVGPRGGKHEGLLEAAIKSGARSLGTQVGRQIVRGVLGSILGGGSSRRR